MFFFHEIGLLNLPNNVTFFRSFFLICGPIDHESCRPTTSSSEYAEKVASATPSWTQLGRKRARTKLSTFRPFHENWATFYSQHQETAHKNGRFRRMTTHWCCERQLQCDQIDNVLKILPNYLKKEFAKQHCTLTNCASKFPQIVI